MVNYKRKCFWLFSYLCVLMLAIVCSTLERAKPPTVDVITEIWLSYIPSIEEFGHLQILEHVSLKKINFFSENQRDKISELEQFEPVIDKVLFVPDGFHEYKNQRSPK